MVKVYVPGDPLIALEQLMVVKDVTVTHPLDNVPFQTDLIVHQSTVPMGNGTNGLLVLSLVEVLNKPEPDKSTELLLMVVLLVLQILPMKPEIVTLNVVLFLALGLCGEASVNVLQLVEVVNKPELEL